ncbi:CPBP family glutamic-type intramembrane protease [Arundinibacter roseus]|uniref:CPBP family intramembrane metalloprotease n=1 Tax=Arundinibacter roseus TaxID=2070510 RepID=A0A4R4JVK6_9BACT|nr:CPBP family glutamic-type intramembrane protease [Arundinibacter roseus]TDB58086.1 CPBP family intramembrane metalloprotease [Arundinibacter roseus]
MKSYLIHFSEFIKNPLYKPLNRPLVIVLFYSIFFSIVSLHIYLFFIVIFQFVIDNYTTITSWNFVENNRASLNDFSNNNFIVAIILAPIIEELVFRGFLNFKKINFYISIFLLIGMVPMFMNFKVNIYITSIIYITCIFCGILISKIENKNIESSILKMKTNYRATVYVSVMIFGFTHITNYENITLNQILFSPITLFPQLLAGFLYSYLRVNYGLIFSITLHSLDNFFVVLVTYLNSK